LLLRYAFYALLRSNIIASQIARRSPFSDRQFHWPSAGQANEETMLVAIVRSIREWRRYRRSLSELSHLDDRELADIGLSRSDIMRVAWNAAHQR
jgi:uncharacterized protein YjiS (DUF1127 family)